MTQPSPDMARLAQALIPERTILLFGAGASHTSGAPTSTELCRHLEQSLAKGESISADLAELSSILEQRYSRVALVDAIIARLSDLKPDPAIRTLAMYPWPSLYSTNYDRLVENAYSASGRPLGVIRSNWEWDNSFTAGITKLYKLHGCISEDRSRGSRSSMVITVEDYENTERYRQLLFNRLQLELAGNTACIIGYSLRDPYIQALVREALRLQREAAAPGRIHVVVHELDDDRAAVWRARGVYSLVRGDLNDFAYALARELEPPTQPPVAAEGAPPPLSSRLAPATIEVACTTESPSPRRMFYGASPNYADIRQGLTFPRDLERDLSSPRGLATVLTGVAGTGKSTAARRLLVNWMQSATVVSYEHRIQYPFEGELWLQHERALRESGYTGILLIDNCTPFQREINSFVRALPKPSAIHVVLTAETSAWRMRQKDPLLFSDATAKQLSVLSANEIRDLRDIVLKEASLRELVDKKFLDKTPNEQVSYLSSRCSSDMFVCLKVLFSSDTLDEIVLREYASIAEKATDIAELYRYTAALESAGALVHRQMVLRLCSMPTSRLSGALGILEGLVVEDERHTALGIFSWRTRHEVIAGIISRYKFSDESELRDLLEKVIDSANPTYHEETRTLREMCNSKRGIKGLPDRAERIRLYRKIASVLPTDNVARHRLIGELLDEGSLGDAEGELKRAIQDVKLDPPLQRYAVKIAIARSRQSGILPEDRLAMLRLAVREADLGISRFGDNKYMYIVKADVAEEIFRINGDRSILSAVRSELDQAQEKLLDPELGDRARRLWML